MAVRGTTKFKSNKQEQRVAKELGGKTVIASGSLWNCKGDVRHDQFLVECKTTEKSFYALTYEVWKKIQTEALRDGLRLPVMCIDLEDGKHKLAVFDFALMYDHMDFFDQEIKTITVDKKSFRVTPVSALLEVKWEYQRPVRLVITDWDTFLEVVSQKEEE